MERIAFYGKGGAGKTTIAAGVSFSLALRGLKVLHIGCDPKHDSTLVLTRDGQTRTVMDEALSRPVKGLRVEHILMPGKKGIDCIEAGGPDPGMGCGGRAVSRMLEILEDFGLLDENRYDAVVFDVLGDVVCGGFAAPLQLPVPPKVTIVVTEELMAAYAAANISKAVLYYLENGASLAGLVVNLRNNRSDLEPIRRLARALNTRILAVVPHSSSILRAEVEAMSVVEFAPRSKAARSIRCLAEDLLKVDARKCRPPTPLDLHGVRRLILNRP